MRRLRPPRSRDTRDLRFSRFRSRDAIAIGSFRGWTLVPAGSTKLDPNGDFDPQITGLVPPQYTLVNILGEKPPRPPTQSFSRPFQQFWHHLSISTYDSAFVRDDCVSTGARGEHHPGTVVLQPFQQFEQQYLRFTCFRNASGGSCETFCDCAKHRNHWCDCVAKLSRETCVRNFCET